MGPSPEFKRRLREAFEALEIGQTFTFRRTFTDGDVALFCGVTGDFNPYHQDAVFAGDSFYELPTVPGLLTGSMLTHIGGMLGFLATGMTFEYLKPVFVGETITCKVTITEKDEKARQVIGEASFVNQDAVEVLRARFGGFPSQVRLAR